MESNTRLSPQARYAYKSASCAVFLSVLFILNKALDMVPFLKEFSAAGLSINDFSSALLSFIAVLVLAGYAKDTSQEIIEMLPSMPSPDKPYRLIIYFLLCVFSYYAFYPLAAAFLKEVFLETYKLLFAGLILWIAASCGLYFYFNKDGIGISLLGLAKKVKS
ncbi:MAG: hypothetical protein AB1637_03960 [Elusimicrobiota bacterium]